MSFINAFQKKYKCGYIFFHQLFPNALELLQKSLPVLDKAISRGDGNEWRQTIKAIKSISEDMCFQKLKNLKVNTNKPNRKDYYIITIEINKLANFQ